MNNANPTRRARAGGSPEVQHLFDCIRSTGRDHHWVLEPGEPFFEEIPPRRIIPVDGKTYVLGQMRSCFALVDPSGEHVALPAGEIRKQIEPADAAGFFSTPNAIARTRNGCLAINRGRWLVTRVGDDAVELTEENQWKRDREETTAERPPWATRTHAYSHGYSVEYLRHEDGIEYARRVRLATGERQDTCEVRLSDSTPLSLRIAAARLLVLASDVEEADRG